MIKIKNQTAFNEWIADLRSGKFAQTRENLRYGDSYCCLGVLGCTLQELFLTDQRWFLVNGDYKWNAMYTGSLPREVFEIVFEDDTSGSEIDALQDTLAKMNDNGYTFDYIADYLERKFNVTKPSNAS